VGVGKATAKSMVLNLVLIHLIGMFGTQVSGAATREPDRRMTVTSRELSDLSGEACRLKLCRRVQPRAVSPRGRPVRGGSGR